MNHNRQIAYGAMMTAVLGILLLLNRLTAQFLENLLIYAYPLPLLVYCVKYGWKSGWAVFAAMIALCVLLSTPSGMVIAGGQVLIGFIYGGMVHQHMPRQAIVTITMVMSAFFTFLQMIVFARFFGYDNEADIAAAGQIVQSLLEHFDRPVPSDADMLVMLKRAMTAAAFIVGAADGLIIHLWAVLLMKRLRMNSQ